jgi:hypothetical protein
MGRGRVVGGRIQLDEAQLRDTALAAALLLTGQDPEEYGFTSQSRAGTAAKFSYANWHLAAEKRDEAFDKWKAWRVDHPDSEKPAADKKP